MSKIGNICIILGAFFLAIAITIAACNGLENLKMDYLNGRVMSKVIDSISYVEEMQDSDSAKFLPDPYSLEMTEKEIDGVKYVGYIFIPDLKLELPVTSKWSYQNLKKSPCRYFGSSKTNDLIIAAHNYKSHFGKIKTLKPGNEVVLTDMDGIATRYEVVATEVLNPTAVDDMTSGEYALTLFTCTYGGGNRVTVRCDKKI